VANVPMTGGTPVAPQTPIKPEAVKWSRNPAVRQRQAAAQRAVKGPSVVSQRAQPRTAARPSGPPRLPQSSPVHAKAPARPAAKPAAKAGPTAFNPISGFLNSQQLGALADQITKQNMGTQLAPLRQQAGEIQGTQSTVSSRYGGYSAATDKLLQGIGTDTATNAKTSENQAADAVLKAGQAVNQTGQSAQAQNGGYLDPQVQAELNAEGKLASGVGGAQNTFAQNAGQNEQNFMGNLRGASAQRAVEGQKSISNTYGGQYAKNAAEQRNLIAKQPADAKSLATTLGQQQFTDYATLQGLGIKTAGVNQAGEKIKQTGQQNSARNRLTERGQNVTRQNSAEKTRTTERGQNITQAHYNEADRTARLKAESAGKKGGLTTTQQNKTAGDFGSAYETIRQLREQKLSPGQIRNVLSTGYLKANVGGKVTTLSAKLV
jgi:hypothetical protein